MHLNLGGDAMTENVRPLQVHQVLVPLLLTLTVIEFLIVVRPDGFRQKLIIFCVVLQKLALF